MIKLEKEYFNRIEELASVFTDTVCYTVMQGIGGSAWVDSVENPSAVAFVYGDLCFLAGSTINIAGDKELLQMLKDCRKTWLIFVPETEEWLRFFEASSMFQESTRYRMKKRTKPFDRELLEGYVQLLPKDFHIERIEKEWYKKLGKEEWSCDLCRQIPTVEEYMEHGLGFLIVKDNCAVAGVSSYSYYDRGIEIEIDTKEEYRKRGFATVLGAKIILECMDRGMYPNWDAANLISVKTAEKLGYELDRSYKAFLNKELGVQ